MELRGYLHGVAFNMNFQTRKLLLLSYLACGTLMWPIIAHQTSFGEETVKAKKMPTTHVTCRYPNLSRPMLLWCVDGVFPQGYGLGRFFVGYTL